MAKVFASEAANRAAREAVQVMGSDGYLEENDAAVSCHDADDYGVNVHPARCPALDGVEEQVSFVSFHLRPS